MYPFIYSYIARTNYYFPLVPIQVFTLIFVSISPVIAASAIPSAMKQNASTENNLLINGDFEEIHGDNPGWILTSSTGRDWFTWGGESVPSGQYAGMIGYEQNENAELAQTIAVPVAKKVSLNFLYYFRQFNDLLGNACPPVELGVRINGTGVSTLDTCRPYPRTHWRPHNLDLSAYAGQTISLAFYIRHSGSDLHMEFAVDAVGVFTQDQMVLLPTIMRPSSMSTCNPTHGSGGLAAGTHDTTVAGLPATVIVGNGYTSAQPTLLVFYLYGGEQDYTRFRNNSNTLTRLTKDRGWIFVAPHYYGNWPAEVDTDPEAEAEIVRRYALILEEMFTRYNVCRTAVMGGSASQGSYDWSGVLFPENGDRYPAYMLLACGASSFWNYQRRGQVNLFGDNESLRLSTRFKYVYGSDDFLYGPIRHSISIYERTGFIVQIEELEGKEHCEFDIDAEISKYWSAVADELMPILFQ